MRQAGRYMAEFRKQVALAWGVCERAGMLCSAACGRPAASARCFPCARRRLRHSCCRRLILPCGTTRRFSDHISFRERSETAEIAIELSLQPWRAFQTDGVIMFSDILTPLPALGIEFDVIKGKGPRIAQPIRRWAAASVAAGRSACCATGQPTTPAVHVCGQAWTWHGTLKHPHPTSGAATPLCPTPTHRRPAARSR